MNRIFLVYEQIVKHYIDRIETHDLNQGDSIESEEDIAAAFSVSRGTVRKAMTELEFCLLYTSPSPRDNV